ncbi:MAG: Hpt domain-containing protein [Phycisphaerales bacterium]|nr:MAG: Hpt domain-containing protein [Phycisphaerales bacterium]
MHTKDFSGIRTNGLLPSPGELDVPGDIADLLDDYIESTTSMLEELEKAALAYEAGTDRQTSAATIRRILHKIKGESGMVGIEDISEFCHQAEYAFEEMDLKQRPDMLLRFKDWVCAAIQNLKG